MPNPMTRVMMDSHISAKYDTGRTKWPKGRGSKTSVVGMSLQFSPFYRQRK